MYRRVKGAKTVGARSGRWPERAVSPIVGIVLLFGIVAIAATILAISGMALVDDLQTNSEAERAQSCLENANHNIETLLAVDGQESVPCDPHFSANGNVTLTWYNADPSSGQNVTIDSLGAFEHRLPDRTLAYQSGGIFERRSDSTTVLREPNVAYDNSTLQLGFIELEGSNASAGESVASMDRGQSRSLANAIEDASSQGYENIRIELTSSYHEGWHSHLKRSLGADTRKNVSVSHHSADNRIVATLENVSDAHPLFVVSDLDSDRFVEYESGEELTVQANVSNVGTESGTDSVSFEITSGPGYQDTRSTGSIDPGNQTTVTFDGVSAEGDIAASGNEHDISRYGEYDYAVETSNVTANSSFFLSYPNDSMYRLENVGHTMNESAVLVSADVTNIGSAATKRDVTVSLQGDHEDLPDPLAEWDEELALDPWENGTIDIELNRTALPSGLNYTYTIDVENPSGVCQWNGGANAESCTQQGTFELPDGNVSNPIDEIIIDEPSDVSVSLLGTEISAEWGGRNSWTKRWGAVTASAVIGDTRYRFLPDGSVEEIDYDDPHDTGPGEEIEDFNLNTFGSQEQVYSHQESIDEGSVTIEATYWTCNGWSTVGTDTWNGRSYTHQECTDFGEPTTVDVASGTAEADSGFVMTRSADRNELPSIEEGYDRQRNVTEVFSDGTDDVDLVDGNLTLEANDFAFMLETTMDQAGLVDEYEDGYEGPHNLESNNQTEVNLAAWDVAQNYREESESDTGDPNFNDVIGFVQVEPGEQYFDRPDNLLLSFGIDGTLVTPEETLPSPDPDDESVDVDAGSGVIIIS